MIGGTFFLKSESLNVGTGLIFCVRLFYNPQETKCFLAELASLGLLECCGGNCGAKLCTRTIQKKKQVPLFLRSFFSEVFGELRGMGRSEGFRKCRVLMGCLLSGFSDEKLAGALCKRRGVVCFEGWC